MPDMVQKTPKQQSTLPQNKCRGKSSEKIKPALLSTCCCAISFNCCELIHRLLQILFAKKTIFLPVGTTRGWTKQLDHNKYRKVDMRHWLRR